MTCTEQLLIRYDAEIARLKESNAELVEAMRKVIDYGDRQAVEIARAAINKAKGETK